MVLLVLIPNKLMMQKKWQQARIQFVTKYKLTVVTPKISTHQSRFLNFLKNTLAIKNKNL